MKTVEIESLVQITQQCDPITLGRPFFRYIDISSIDRETKSITAVLPVASKVAPSRARKLVLTGDVLISTVRPNLNAVALVPRQYDSEIASTGFCVLRPNPKLLKSVYLYYFTQTDYFISRLVQFSTGAGYPAVSDTTILETEIPFLPLAEQQHIAELLERTDHLRRARRYALQLSDNLLQATFLEMFGDPVSNPMGWGKVEIAEVCSQIVDCVNRTAPIVSEVTPYKMIRTTNVRNGMIDTSNTRRVTREVYERWTRRSIPQIGDVILTREAPLGEVGMVRDNDTIFLGQRIMQFRPEPNKIDSLFLLYMFMTKGMQEYLKLLGSGSTVEHIPVPDCKTIVIALPPLEKQQEYAAIVRKVERLRRQQTEALRQADALFGKLLHDAFSPSHPDPSPLMPHSSAGEGRFKSGTPPLPKLVWERGRGVRECYCHSRQARRGRLQRGLRSFLRALASIWRMRSRVTRKCHAIAYNQ